MLLVLPSFFFIASCTQLILPGLVGLEHGCFALTVHGRITNLGRPAGLHPLVMGWGTRSQRPPLALPRRGYADSPRPGSSRSGGISKQPVPGMATPSVAWRGEALQHGSSLCHSRTRHGLRLLSDSGFGEQIPNLTGETKRITLSLRQFSVQPMRLLLCTNYSLNFLYNAISNHAYWKLQIKPSAVK